MSPHPERSCPTGAICDDCIVAEGSCAGMTYGQVKEMTAMFAAAGCANCGSPHDHDEHPGRCCDETCP